jgi:uncharacterized membrane protein
MAKLIKYFITGMAVLLPLALTISFILYLISELDLISNINHFFIEIGIILIFIVLVGFLSNMYFGNNVATWAESQLLKIPIIGFVYKSIKDVTTAFVGHDKKFTEPVAIKMAESNIYKLGFITHMAADELSKELKDQNLYAVYFPISFSIAGDLYLVPKEQIILLDEKPKEVMQYIISGGIINLKKE